jgi:hypothetical protein
VIINSSSRNCELMDSAAEAMPGRGGTAGC